MKSIIMIFALGALLAVGSQGATIQISFTNLAPLHGTWIMRPWVGLHDGNYQTFAVGQPGVRRCSPHCRRWSGRRSEQHVAAG